MIKVYAIAKPLPDGSFELIQGSTWTTTAGVWEWAFKVFKYEDIVELRNNGYKAYPFYLSPAERIE